MSALFELDITLTEPTILTDGSSDSAGGHETLLYITGSSVLGAMVGALGISPTDSNDLFSRMFLSPHTRFLNAYPVTSGPDGKGRRTLPRPLTFKQGKTDASRVIDGLDSTGAPRTIGDLRIHFKGTSDNPKSGKATFILDTTPGNDWSPHRTEQVHVGIDRTTRAAQKGVLFTYESMPRGIVFRSAIITDDEDVASRLRKELGCKLTLRIGRSRSAGYGSAVASLVEVANKDNWRETESPVCKPASRTVLTLLSDYLPFLESSPSNALCAELAAHLGISPESIQPRATATRIVRGFRGVWGLPRPARTALAKGSVFVIECSIGSQKSDAILRSGIGARTNEGFGRFVLNWSVLGTKTDGGGGPGKLDPVKITRVSAGSSLAAIEIRRNERLRQRFVEKVLAQKEMKDVVASLDRVPRSQLGNLRAAVTGSLTVNEIGDWFTGISEKTAGTRWKKANLTKLRSDDCAKSRNGIGFVWSSLFGGTTDNQGRSDNPSGSINFDTAIRKTFAPLLDKKQPLLIEAALANPDRTVRLLISSLCSEVVRASNLKRKDKDKIKEVAT